MLLGCGFVPPLPQKDVRPPHLSTSEPRCPRNNKYLRSFPQTTSAKILEIVASKIPPAFLESGKPQDNYILGIDGCARGKRNPKEQAQTKTDDERTQRLAPSKFLWRAVALDTQGETSGSRNSRNT